MGKWREISPYRYFHHSTYNWCLNVPLCMTFHPTRLVDSLWRDPVFSMAYEIVPDYVTG